MARGCGAWSHSDAVQAVGHLPVDFAGSGLDLLSFTAHKLGGPYGIGVLLARREVGLTPVQHGGGQERDVRSGTFDVAAAAGFAAALEVAVRDREAERRASVRCGTGWLTAYWPRFPTPAGTDPRSRPPDSPAWPTSASRGASPIRS